MQRRDRYLAYIIGTGLVLFAIHNPHQPFLEYLFLPWLGMMMVLMGCAVILLEHKAEITFGPRWLWIPLVIIAVSIATSGYWQMAVGNVGIREGFAPTFIAVALFAVYLSSRIVGQKLFTPFLYAVVITALSIVIYGIVNPGVRTGGIVSPTNYDMAAGILVFGTLVSAVRHQWWLSAIAIVGLVLSGAEEALLAMGILVAIVLIRRDWSRKILLPISIAVFIVFIGIVFAFGNQLYKPVEERMDAAKQLLYIKDSNDYLSSYTVRLQTTDGIVEAYPVITASAKRLELWEVITNDRVRTWKAALNNIKPFGNGYNMTAFYELIPHNIPLIIVHQVGILAALAWLFVVGYCLVKTKYRYAFVGVLGLGLLDHYLWTQVAPWWWALVGVSSALEIKTDLIFKESK